MTINVHTLLRAALVALVLAAWWRAFRTGGFGLAFIGTFLAIVVGVAHRRWQIAEGRRFILAHTFPTFLRAKVLAAHPELSQAQLGDIERGLRQFFVASLQARGRFVAMPSKAVDALWHEFILHTRGYQAFCARAFGRMLHHTPAEALGPKATQGSSQFAGLRRAWYWSCKEEGIDPRKPDRLPLLFALDTTLAIVGGYHYVPDCSLLGADRGSTHCGTSFGCGSSCGSSSGGDGSSNDGGCGGSGCGGGGD